MDQTQMNEKSCSICNQRFKTDRELQEHQHSMHAQDKGGTGSGRTSDSPAHRNEKDERAA
jgi:hypothetical protein